MFGGLRLLLILPLKTPRLQPIVPRDDAYLVPMSGYCEHALVSCFRPRNVGEVHSGNWIDIDPIVV